MSRYFSRSPMAIDQSPCPSLSCGPTAHRNHLPVTSYLRRLSRLDPAYFLGDLLGSHSSLWIAFGRRPCPQRKANDNSSPQEDCPKAAAEVSGTPQNLFASTELYITPARAFTGPSPRTGCAPSSQELGWRAWTGFAGTSKTAAKASDKNHPAIVPKPSPAECFNLTLERSSE